MAYLARGNRGQQKKMQIISRQSGWMVSARPRSLAAARLLLGAALGRPGLRRPGNGLCRLGACPAGWRPADSSCDGCELVVTARLANHHGATMLTTYCIALYPAACQRLPGHAQPLHAPPIYTVSAPLFRPLPAGLPSMMSIDAHTN